MSNHPAPPAPSAEQEVSRARARRVALGITRPQVYAETPQPEDTARAGQWALALSGGGIRSATFCLGVLQSLAKIADPGASPGPGLASASSSGAAAAQHPTTSGTATDTPKALDAEGDAASPASATSNNKAPPRTYWPLLAQFDYLSTVSGGGYIGGFFSSLFVRGRLSGVVSETALDATERAYEALKEEPPGRIHRDTNYEPQHPGRTALAWLRDNGRYMAPSGTGDLVYGITIAVRNWLSTQYVVATVVVLMLSLLQMARWALTAHCPPYRDWEGALLNQALNADTMIWWSPSWALCGIVLWLMSLPLGIAYWFTHPVAGRHLSQQVVDQLNRAPGSGVPPAGTLHDHLAMPPLYWTAASLLGLALGVVLSAIGVYTWSNLGRETLACVVLGLGFSTLLSVGWYGVATWRTHLSKQNSITWLRVLLTRWLTQSVLLLMGAAGLATIETVAQTAWLWLSVKHGAAISGVLALLVWLLREAAPKLSDRSPNGLLKKVPVGLLAGVIGGGLWLTVAAALDITVLQIAWPHGWANPQVIWDAAQSQQAFFYATGISLLTLTMAWVVGHFPGFLNLSTLQNLYSARIIRAYLGATNHARFTPDAGSEARDVAEPIAGDSLSADDIHRNPLAPIHFVNVCVNQSVSPGEQLIQRDRKGKPLVVAPGGAYFDQNAYALGTGSDESELCFPLSFGEWLGVSGAAFSTGLGRGTGLGMSLAMGFANVRLGRWWKGLPRLEGMQESWLRCRFTTQAYLLDELRGLFYGDHKPYQYLSDGGHFENMAVYELLRTDRQRLMRLIVVCDCGCDPNYEFEDLANLTRLVRIDHGLEIRVHKRAHGEALLNQVFARPEDFKRGADGKLPEANGRCAIMLDVLGTERSADQGVKPGELFARIILLKPTLLAHLGVDLDQYHAGHAEFPQETTMDQFFDEAQWESYRQLGMRIGQRVFTADGMPGYPEKLWQVCMDGLPA